MGFLLFIRESSGAKEQELGQEDFCKARNGCEQEGVYDHVKLMKTVWETGRRLTELSIVIGCFGAITVFIVLVGEMFGSISVSIECFT